MPTMLDLVTPWLPRRRSTFAPMNRPMPWWRMYLHHRWASIFPLINVRSSDISSSYWSIESFHATTSICSMPILSLFVRHCRCSDSCAAFSFSARPCFGTVRTIGWISVHHSCRMQVESNRSSGQWECRSQSAYVWRFLVYQSNASSLTRTLNSLAFYPFFKNIYLIMHVLPLF